LGRSGDNSFRIRSDPSPMGSDSDDSSSGSSSSDSSSRRKERRKERKERKKREKKEKKREEKKRRKQDKHEKKPKKSKSKDAARSIVTGKRIQKKDFAAADAEGEARREAMRAAMNEGEDDEYGAKKPAASASQAAAQEVAKKALSDPAVMLELMRASQEAQAAKRQRLSALRGSQDGGGDDYASAIGREYAIQRSSATGKRTAYDAADYMKRDAGF
jgi:hypothetical protein